MKKLDSITFEAELVVEGSWGSRPQGTHESTMTLWGTEDRYRFAIEWDIPALDTTEEIGIWTEHGVLTDYDGVFSLPEQAIALLRKNGITVPEDFEE